eukprot:EG_transcript_16893
MLLNARFMCGASWVLGHHWTFHVRQSLTIRRLLVTRTPLQAPKSDVIKTTKKWIQKVPNTDCTQPKPTNPSPKTAQFKQHRQPKASRVMLASLRSNRGDDRRRTLLHIVRETAPKFYSEVMLTIDFSSGRVVDEQLASAFSKLRCSLLDRLSKPNDFDVAKFTWRCAVSGFRDDALMRAVAHFVVQPEISQTLSPSSMAKISWAFAKLCVLQEEMMAVIAARVFEGHFLRTFSPKEVANIAWAFGKLCICNRLLMASIAQRIQEDNFLADFTPQGLVNLVWAFATLGFHHNDLLASVARRIVQEEGFLATFTPQGVAILIWAFATLGVRNDDLLASVARRIAQEEGFLATFTPQNVANLVWAFATL